MSESILQRIARGDASGVEACLDEYGGLVLALAERYLRSVGGDAEDAVQEVFVELWRNAGRFDPVKGSEASFVATIAHRRLIDRRRKESTSYAVRAGSGWDEGAGAARASMGELSKGGVHAAGVRDEARVVSEAFERLSPDEREALSLSIHYGLSHEGISRALGAPLGTVKTRIRRGLDKLREAVQFGAGGRAVGSSGKGAAR